MNDVGKMMYDRRKELGLTLEEVGNYVGVGKSTVRKWENGMIKNMGRDKISLLAKVLQLSPVDFVPADDGSYGLDQNETYLVDTYRHLNPRGKSLLLERAEELSVLQGEKCDQPLSAKIS